jgi:alpha-N-arabinofuranosidase
MRIFTSLLAALALQLTWAQSGTVVIDASHPLHKVSPDFFGLMTEEINHSYDGGLYAELVQNRSFRDDANLAHWAPVGGATIQQGQGEPAPFATVNAPAGGGISNDGYFGVPAKPGEQLHLRLIGRAAHGATVHVYVESKTGEICAGSRPLMLGKSWQSFEDSLAVHGNAPFTDGRIVVASASPSTFDLRYVSVIPPTFHGRTNGNRPDLMAALAGLRPSFLRLPGGNYLEGRTLKDFFPWKQTLGDPADRPGHWGPWGYRSSDGMGLLEFLEWCEDLHMSPLLAVYAGYALDGTYVKPGPDLEPIVNSALEEIEFVAGSPNTKLGRIRAKLGHPRPFPLTYVEVGNEDWFDRSGSYDARFAQFFKAIRASYPNLEIIATTPVRSAVPDLVDDHFYRSAAAMARDEHHYDFVDRNGPKVFVGEWASMEGRPTPSLQAALGDAAWLIGMERNSDLVLMEAYAPLLVNVNRGAAQWGTNLIGYDANSVVLSPSYYVQALFAQTAGDEALPVSIDIPEGPKAQVFQKGRAGLATYRTQAEYKDFSITGPSGDLYNKPFTADDPDWTRLGGTWHVTDGVLTQTGNERLSQMLIGSRDWTDYTIHVKARKISGQEGFIVVFYNADGYSCQWDVGGWNNTRSAVQILSPGDQVELPLKNEPIEAGRWYDLSVSLKGNLATCYLDGNLMGTAVLQVPPVPAVHVGAVRNTRTGEVSIRAVNLSDSPFSLRFKILGIHKGKSRVKAWVLSGAPGDQNTIDAPDHIAPRREDWQFTGDTLDRVLPPHSLSVWQVKGN